MKAKHCLVMAIIFLFLVPFRSMAWEGYDYDKGNYIEIEKGNKVRSGETIEIYDYDAGEYKDVEVNSIDRYGRSVEVEVTDTETGESRTFEMDD